MVTSKLSSADLQIKRVTLHSKRRKGYYYRIKTQESKERAEGVILVNRYHYFKFSSKVRTRAQASSAFQYYKLSRVRGVSKLPTTSGVAKGTPISAAPGEVEKEEEEYYTLHVRMDYDAADGARSGHNLVMRDSWISRKFKKDIDMDTIHQSLLNEFKSAFKHEFSGSNKHGFINAIMDEGRSSLVNGIERGGYTEKVLFNYSSTGESGSFRQIDRSLTQVRAEEKSKAEFLARSRR
jgi:hypothetical protein